MRSHVYQLTGREWLRAVVPVLVCIAGFVAMSHVAKRLNVPRPSRQPGTLDEAILHEKTNNCTKGIGAGLVFVGDSSCLMDVSARELIRLNPTLNPWNLGTLSTLGLPRFRDFLECYLAHNQEKPPRVIILLLSPEMVRGSAVQLRIHQPSFRSQERKRALLAQQQRIDPRPYFDRPLTATYEALGLPYMRDRLAARLITAPINQRWGEFYGFFPDVERYMTFHHGCAVDPSTPANAATTLALSAQELSPLFRDQCVAFRAGLPAPIRLAVGLTPAPQSSTPDSFAFTRNRVLSQIKSALEAEAALVDLPATLADHYFASATHLNSDGARLFTHYLYRSLREKDLLAVHADGNRPLKSDSGFPEP